MPGAACLITLTLIARLSWYDPGLCPFAPINCFDPASPFHMASGEDARDWYGRVLACPPEYALGTVFVISGSRWGLADGRWRCLDRGGAVITEPNGTLRLDLLSASPVWAEVIPVSLMFRTTCR